MPTKNVPTTNKICHLSLFHPYFKNPSCHKCSTLCRQSRQYSVVLVVWHTICGLSSWPLDRFQKIILCGIYHFCEASNFVPPRSNTLSLPSLPKQQQRSESTRQTDSHIQLCCSLIFKCPFPIKLNLSKRNDQCLPFVLIYSHFPLFWWNDIDKPYTTSQKGLASLQLRWTITH